MSNQVGDSHFLAANTPNPGKWYVQNSNTGWPGNYLIEPQPLNTNALMFYEDAGISLQSDGRYRFWVAITNQGPNSTFFNLQLSKG
jgi:hypothetical protein